LLVAEVLIIPIACSPGQTTLPVTVQSDKEETSFVEGTTSPIVTEIAPSPVQTPLSVTAQADREATSLTEETAPLITTTIETVITPQEIEMPSKGNSKLDSSLNQLLTEYRREGLAAAQAFARMHQINLNNDLVQVEVIATEEAVIPSLKETVEAIGGEYQGHYQTMLQALVPIDALESLAGQTDVQVIRQPRRPVTP
jgi:hypothetical protein